MYDTTIAGPAWFAAAVPVRTKIPVPMIAPIPRSVRSHAVRLRRRALPRSSTSLTSCSIDLVLRRFESIRPPGLRLRGCRCLRVEWTNALLLVLEREPDRHALLLA